MSINLILVPITLAEANAFVVQHHRHHPPVQGHLFSLAAATDEGICATAIIGRPVARMRQDGWTCELTRLCVAEHIAPTNCASWLLGRVRRAAGALGYRILITYTLASESGVSLRAANFRELHISGGGTWSRPSRPRVDKHPTQQKIAWESDL